MTDEAALQKVRDLYDEARSIGKSAKTLREVRKALSLLKKADTFMNTETYRHLFHRPRRSGPAYRMRSN